MPVLICPGAPRKGKDVLLDREAIERARKDISPPDVGGYVTPPGRLSPLRNSWSVDQSADNIVQLQPFLDRLALRNGGGGAGSKKTVRFGNGRKPRVGAIGSGGYSLEHRENDK
ncbi:hypothetical protein F5B22DRAFT_598930 [Xylaria bambusicola]|uniref:uncharacterized protein n=1 Tax=Xylaria bambusicola TaxID=326684 RepID=UPI00200891F8|nr:uncharacterized protein F5B22DRAFT_598930 [Xylaria bambusicola]KAI0518378.1 hypothetical protein F5B22DRAFT_598930 [Xylaria bambusicola]